MSYMTGMWLALRPNEWIEAVILEEMYHGPSYDGLDAADNAQSLLRVRQDTDGRHVDGEEDGA